MLLKQTDMDASFTNYLLDRSCVLLDGHCNCERSWEDCKYGKNKRLSAEDEETKK